MMLEERIRKPIRVVEKQLRDEIKSNHPVAHVMETQRLLETMYAAVESLGYNVSLRRRYFSNKVNHYFKKTQSEDEEQQYTRIDLRSIDSPYDS